MAQELYTRTNQKMFFAGLSLESWPRPKKRSDERPGADPGRA
jgi:hypothetical protein